MKCPKCGFEQPPAEGTDGAPSRNPSQNEGIASIPDHGPGGEQPPAEGTDGAPSRNPSQNKGMASIPDHGPCGEQPPADSCADCGVIFARYFEYLDRKENETGPKQKPGDQDPAAPPPCDPGDLAAGPAGPRMEQLNAWDTLRAIHRSPWNPVSSLAGAACSIAFAVLLYLLARHSVMAAGNESLVLYLLHEANLAFHEAGHFFFQMFGRVIGILGGTLGQLLVPLTVTAHFWQRRDAAGFAFGGFWFFENFLDVAHYMADARALLLPLIGGLGAEAHDWRNLFMEWGVLRQDTQIAAWVRTLGWIGMLGTWAWLVRRWRAENDSREK